MNISNQQIKNDNRKSRFISLILRHKPEIIGITLDKHGYTNCEELCKKLDITFERLQRIVDNDDKHRYKFSNDKKLIRASQGHSIHVELDLKDYVPKSVLFHGTVIKNYDSIKGQGLRKMNREYVHLSNTVDVAKIVADRRKDSIPLILTIDAVQMYNTGYKFYISENNVILTDYVPSKYITI